MIRFGYEMENYIVFLHDGHHFKVKSRRIHAKYIRNSRELHLYSSNGTVQKIEAEEYNEYRRIGIPVYVQVEECEIPRITEQAAVAAQ